VTVAIMLLASRARANRFGVVREDMRMLMLHGVHHLALTVTDIDRSTAWYVRLLGFEEFARRDDPDNQVRKAVLRAPDGFVLTLVQHGNASSQPFDERVTGMDHVAFLAASQEELHEWERRLAGQGIDYTPATPSLTVTGAEVVVFRDPDGIQLEIWANPAPAD
jgi:glyoxylase I family protein